jgi:hypothetical protein
LLCIPVGKDVRLGLLRGSRAEAFEHVSPDVHGEASVPVHRVEEADVSRNPACDRREHSVHDIAPDQLRLDTAEEPPDLDDEAWTVVKNTPGVTGFVGAGSKPVPLSQIEVDRILHTGTPAGAPARAQVEFSLGESVKVTSGPLSDFDGEIVDVNPDQQKLKVLVDIFERQVPVELAFDQVKKID